MRTTAFLAGIVLILPLLAAPTARAASADQPPRWVMADEVRVRVGPSAEHKIIGTLSRGAELILKTRTEVDGFCLIEGEGHYGYIACRFLSAERIARPRAGVDGVDAAQRWVSGNGVTLRDAPSPEAAIVGRLTLNAVVTLRRDAAGNGYCEVALADGLGAYTACRYLAVTPVVLAHVRGYRSADQPVPADYDPERAFWISPSWQALEDYVEYLKRQHPDLPPQGPWPRNAALERMKAHLALGLKGRQPEPYADWAALKRKAARDVDLSGEGRRLRAQGRKVSDASWQREAQMQGLASELQGALGLWGPLHDAISSDGGAERVVHLVRALDFPAVRPSLFRSEAEVAPPSASTEAASGRFDIVFRQLVSPRPVPKPDTEETSGAGLYDMLARTALLVRPVQRVQLFRDGRLRSESSLVRRSETLWREVDEPMCAGWEPGYAFGDADARIWRDLNGDTAPQGGSTSSQATPIGKPPGSLYAFLTTIELPQGPAKRIEAPMILDRDTTGFVRGIYLHYDLDHDGVADLSLWEGEGNGPGHLDGPTTADHRWYRLVLVNIAGAWKVLGSDAFGYGCGC